MILQKRKDGIENNFATDSAMFIFCIIALNKFVLNSVEMSTEYNIIWIFLLGTYLLVANGYRLQLPSVFQLRR